MSESAKHEDYKVTQVASVIVVHTDDGQPVGLDMVMHENVTTSEEAVQVLQHLGNRVQDLSWNLNVLKRHAVTLSEAKGHEGEIDEE